MRFSIFIITCLVFLSPNLYSQTQIGSDIDGLIAGDKLNTVALSADGNVLAVGAYSSQINGVNSGYVRVFQRVNDEWVQLGQDIYGAQNESLGWDVSLSSNGNILAIGLWLKSKVYQFVNDDWQQLGIGIELNDIDETFHNVSLSDDGLTIVIGDRGPYIHGYPATGITRIFRYISEQWTQLGGSLIGAVASHSGYSVDLSTDGNIVVIGADGADVKVFQYQGGDWTQLGQNIEGPETFGSFGNSVSISDDGTIVAIGDSNNSDFGTQTGLTRIYKLESGNWNQLGNQINGSTGYEYCGSSVSLSSDGTILVISFTGADSNGVNSGQVQIFRNILNTWTQVGSAINGEATDDLFGRDLELSSDGSTVAIATPFNDGNGIDSGHARVYDLSALLSIEQSTLSEIKLFPNPAKNYFTIQLPEGLDLKQITIYNNLGEIIKSVSNNIVTTIDLSSGVYFVEISTNYGTETKKLIKF